jgi:multidrug resistance efflux pump
MKIFIILILFFLLPASAPCQSTRPGDELKRLRAEFIAATNDYKTSLAKLLTIYEKNVEKAEEKLELSRKLLSEGLVEPSQVEENERNLARDREKVAETKRQLGEADKQIAAVLDEAKLAQEYKRAKLVRKRAKQKPCLNWDLVMSQRQTANSLSFNYKIVCR